MRSLTRHRKIPVGLMMLALLQCAGLHWVGLYTAAKTIQTYNTMRSQGVAAAIQRIPMVSGTCGLCQKIRMAKTRENQEQPKQQQASLQQLQGLNFVLDARGFTPFVKVNYTGRLSTLIYPWQVRGESPPTPPPRLA